MLQDPNACVRTSIAIVLGRLPKDIPAIDPAQFDSYNEWLLEHNVFPVTYANNLPLTKYNGILFLVNGHAVAWKDGMVIDPNGGTYEYNRCKTVEIFVALIVGIQCSSYAGTSSRLGRSLESWPGYA